VKEMLSNVGRNSSWATKQNAISALRIRGKVVERLDSSLLLGDVIRRGISTVLGYLSDGETKLLLQQYDSVEILTNFRIDLRCDMEPEWMPHVPNWDDRRQETQSMGQTTDARNTMEPEFNKTYGQQNAEAEAEAELKRTHKRKTTEAEPQRGVKPAAGKCIYP